MSAKPQTIDEYVAPLSNEKRAALEKLRRAIKSAAPKAEECISYQISAFRRLIYSAVSRIPQGRVATYGQVARLARIPGQARLVGYALSALPEGSAIPWHRVVNAKGTISARTRGSGHDELQRVILQREGVLFSPLGVISLVTFQWRPRRAGSAIQ